MGPVFTIVITVAGIWIAVMMALKGVVFLLRKQTGKAARTALHTEVIRKFTDNSNYLGAHFPGPNLPPRTSGVLVLTETRLFFLPWFPRRAITLPRDFILSVKASLLFGDKSYNIPALILTVRGVGDPDGEMAWLVHDPEGWEREINQLIRRQE